MPSFRSHGDDEDADSKSIFCWWRSAEEFDEKGRLKVDLSNISKLAPRLKVIKEMERLALIAREGLDDLRHKLMSYRSGDFWLPTGGVKKEEMEIPPMITILLTGFVGSGKSSLINLMYSVLGRAGLVPFAQTSGNSSNYMTMHMKEHNVLRSMRNGFCVYDSRGLDYNQMAESLDGLSEWVVDGVRHHQLCCRASDDVSVREGGTLPSLECPSTRFARRRVNCVVLVVSVLEIYRLLKDGDRRLLEATRELFNCPAIRRYNENPILILTQGDMLSTEERLESRVTICEYLGVSETTGVYDIPCLTEHGILAEESDPVSAYTLAEAVYRALLFSDRTHLPKRNLMDCFLVSFSVFMCYISTFFTFLASCFSKLSKRSNKLNY